MSMIERGRGFTQAASWSPKCRAGAVDLVRKLDHPDADRRLVAYVAAMVRHARIDARRRRPWVVLEPQHVVAFHDPGQGMDLRAIVGAVSDAFARVRRHRPRMVDTLDQLEALARGELTMDGLVDRIRQGGEAHTTVRDRLYKRHLRARRALDEELDTLVEDGVIGPDLREAASDFIRERLRRRRA